MDTAELKSLTVQTALASLRAGNLSATDLTQAVLARIREINDEMHAFITVTEATAQRAAKRAEHLLSSGKPGGLLEGIPLSIKDLFDTQGTRTTAGSMIWNTRVPQADASAVRRLKRAGSVMVGKTNLHEFAFGVTGNNPHFGAAGNPWDASRIAGGSSGGSAVAVAMGAGLASLGSDTGGSIRIPAALCGVVGFKPTFGLIDMEGAIPLAPSMDTAGPITKTVDDAALMLEALTGRKYLAVVDGVSLEGKRIGVPQFHLGNRVEPGVASAFAAALQTLEKLGTKVVQVDWMAPADQQRVFAQIAAPQAWLYHEPMIAEHGDQYGADVRTRVETARTMLSIDFLRAQADARLLTEDLDLGFQTVDLLATPTVPIVAPAIGQTDIQWPDGPEPVLAALTRFTRTFNLTGFPAISVPCGFSNGLPVGLQLAGPAGKDGFVLGAARLFERA